MTIKYIFFDLGGTLIDMSLANYAIVSAMKDILPENFNLKDVLSKWEQEGLNILYKKKREGEFFNERKLGYEGFKNVLSNFNIELNNMQILDLIKTIERSLIQNYKLYQDTIPTLKYLFENGYDLGIITDGDENIVLNVLEKYELTNLFKVIIISSVVGAYKPDIKLFNAALKKAKCDSNNAIYVGDSIFDIFGAKKIGLTSVVINRNEHDKNTVFVDNLVLPESRDELKNIKPNYIINSLPELYQIIDNISKRN